MKNLIKTALLISVFSSGMAQSTKLSPLKLSSINFSFGFYSDIYQRMDMDAMRDISTNTAIFNQNLDGYTESLWRESSGTLIVLDAQFYRLNPLTQEYDRNKIVRFGISYSEREPAVSYNKTSVDSNGMRQVQYSIVYCNVQNEVNLNGAYIWKSGGNQKRILRFYAGLGGNMGLTFNDEMIVMQNTNTTVMDSTGKFQYYNQRYDSQDDIIVPARTALFLRAYAPVGVELNVWKAKLGLEGSAGFGMHQIMGGRTYFMPFNYSLNFRLGINFN